MIGTRDVLDAMTSEATGDSLRRSRSLVEDQKKFLSEVLHIIRSLRGRKRRMNKVGLVLRRRRFAWQDHRPGWGAVNKESRPCKWQGRAIEHL